MIESTDRAGEVCACQSYNVTNKLQQVVLKLWTN